MATTTQDFVKRIDLTALTTVTGSEMNQLIDAATVADDKGLRIVTTDNADGTPNVPNPDVELEGITPTYWKRYKWVRMPHEDRSEIVREYNWNENLVADATYLKWEQFADLASIEADVQAALDAAQDAETAAAAAQTQATNATNTANTAQATANAAQVTADLANSKADTNTATLNFYGQEITDITNLYTLLNDSLASLNARLTRVPLAIFYASDQKTQGTHGGTFTQDTWIDRDIGFLITNNPTYSTYCVLDASAKTLTLQPGVWDIEFDCPGVFVNTHLARLVDTGGTVYAYGTSASCDTGIQPVLSKISATVTVPAGGKIFKVQHRCSLTRNDYGLGYATGIFTETYTIGKLAYLGA